MHVSFSFCVTVVLAFYTQRSFIVVAFIEPELPLSATMSQFLLLTLNGAVDH